MTLICLFPARLYKWIKFSRRFTNAGSCIVGLRHSLARVGLGARRNLAVTQYFSSIYFLFIYRVHASKIDSHENQDGQICAARRPSSWFPTRRDKLRASTDCGRYSLRPLPRARSDFHGNESPHACRNLGVSRAAPSTSPAARSTRVGADSKASSMSSWE
uniref:Uncharacterized protein n=1 Tax=Candidatus Kentrum sp. LPFa TaxID=2126335 RepID=A0A450W5C9_9GAMM|nr:MAG: hypothetical protein BECKLPF1236B_GA0070989_10329 [Candidatus Kentron sp. LPFa]